MRDLLVRLALILPLVQILAPAAAAFNLSGDEWCRSVSSQTPPAGKSGQQSSEGQCLVCIAFAIGGSAAPAALAGHAAPCPTLAGFLTPQLSDCAPAGGKERSAPIRAPPECKPEIRQPAAFEEGTALA